MWDGNVSQWVDSEYGQMIGGKKTSLFVRMETVSNDKGAEIFGQNWNGTQRT